MNVDKAIEFVDSEIEKLEKAIYVFDSIMAPRARNDKEILESLRGQRLRMEALKRKMDAGEDITQDEINQMIPSQFR